MKPTPAVEALVDLALREDIGSGDLTSEFFLPPGQEGSARVVAREECVWAGGPVAACLLQKVSPSLQAHGLLEEGTHLVVGQAAMELSGPVAALLSAERTLLNFVQKLSGIATLTRRYIEALEGSATRLLDTRKTTPGWRELEKAAVAAGGGTNHRMGLYDQVMLKDNHLAALENDTGLLAARLREFRRLHPDIVIEIEADHPEQVQAFASLPEVDVILLDNMSPEVIRHCLSYRRAGLKFEASGGVTLETIRAYAATGVDFISVGALTHSAPSVDLGLDWGAAGGGK